MGMVVHAEIDFGNCVYSGVCKDRLKVFGYDDWRGFSIDPCPHKMRRDFYNHYKDDAEMKRVDIVIASHPSANIELYMALNKSLIVYATTRLNFGRHDANIDWRQNTLRQPGKMEEAKIKWIEWLHNLKHIALNPKNVLAANNLYDKHYIEYFTGLPVHYLPSLCTPKHPDLLHYVPFRQQFLIGPSRDNLDLGPPNSDLNAPNTPKTLYCMQWLCNADLHPLMRQLQAAVKQNNEDSSNAEVLQIVRVRSLYADIHIQDVLNHRAMILFPYQSSVMFAIEMYRANVPLLAPTKRFLKEWHLKYKFLFERVYGWPERYLLSKPKYPDPNQDDAFTLDVWLEFFDIYHFKYIVLFDTFEQLMDQLRTVDFHAIHVAMVHENHLLEKQIVKSWQNVLSRTNIRFPGTNVVNTSMNINEALREQYGSNVWPVAEKSCLSEIPFAEMNFLN
jgi:hypothetical protein